MSTDDMLHTREVYSALDFIGDVGGLFDGILYIFEFFFWLLGVLGRNPLMGFLISKIFTSLNEQTDQKQAHNLGCCFNPLPCFFSKKTRILTMGTTSVEKELEITKFVTR